MDPLAHVRGRWGQTGIERIRGQNVSSNSRACSSVSPVPLAADTYIRRHPNDGVVDGTPKAQSMMAGPSGYLSSRSLKTELGEASDAAQLGPTSVDWSNVNPWRLKGLAKAFSREGCPF